MVYSNTAVYGGVGMSIAHPLLSIFTYLKHLMVLFKWHFLGLNFLHLIKGTDSML